MNTPSSGSSRGIGFQFQGSFFMSNRQKPQPTPIGPLRRDTGDLAIKEGESHQPQPKLPPLGPLEFLDAGGTTSVQAAQCLVEGLCLGYYGDEWREMPLPPITVTPLDFEPWEFVKEENVMEIATECYNKFNLEANRFPPVPNVVVASSGGVDREGQQGFDIFGENTPVWMDPTNAEPPTMGQSNACFPTRDNHAERPAAQRIEPFPSWRLHPFFNRGRGSTRFDNRNSGISRGPRFNSDLF